MTVAEDTQRATAAAAPFRRRAHVAVDVEDAMLRQARQRLQAARSRATYLKRAKVVPGTLLVFLVVAFALAYVAEESATAALVRCLGPCGLAVFPCHRACGWSFGSLTLSAGHVCGVSLIT